jgi:tRNA (guanine-N7-)-methyltransferase
MDETQYPPLRPQINRTKGILNPNVYINALEGEYSKYAFSEERAPIHKGKWRRDIFNASPEETPLDVEFGTGNGHHFAHHAIQNPNRLVMGLELKYKPLIQTIRRALFGGAQNARISRYHAHNIDLIFEPQEINNVYIHFPDPWERPRKFKNRIVCETFLKRLFELQRPGSFIEFKTDSREYFLWALNEIKRTPYKIELKTLDLHSTDLKENNFVTTFERIFIRQNIPINYVKLIRT